MLILALFPILSYYPFFSELISIGNTLLLVFLLYVIFAHHKRIDYPKPFVTLWIFVAVASVITAKSFKVTLLIPGGVSFCMFAVALGAIKPFFNIQYLRKYTFIISALAIAIFIVQEFTYSKTGIRFVALLPMDPLLYAGMTYKELVASHISSERSCAFFCETAYYAQYLLISLCIELFAFTQENKLFNVRTVILAIALLASRSGCGIVGLATLLFIKFISYNKKLSFSSITISCLFVGVLTYFLGGWITEGSGNFLIERSAEFNSDTSSGYIRTIRGYFIYNELPSFNKILGMSLNEVGVLAESRGIYEQGTGFISNGLQSVLIIHGFIGLFLWFVFLTIIYKHTSLIGRASLLLLLSLSLMESVYLSPIMLILLITAQTGCKINKTNRMV